MIDDELGGRPVWLIGAGGTIGQAIARLLSERGAVLALSGRNREGLEHVARSLPGRAIVAPVDLLQDASVREAAQSIKAQLGSVGSLVTSVSISAFGDFLELADGAFIEAMETKYMGAVRAMRAVLPDMIAQRYGRIVTISGGSGTNPRPVHMPGGAANAALELLSRGVAMRYAKEGVRVNVIAPGPISSPRMSAIVATSNAAGQGDGERPTGQPRDVAEAVAYLLGPRSTFVNGTVLKLDGGIR